MRIGSVLLVIWLFIGGIAAAQRGDYQGARQLQHGEYHRDNHYCRSLQLRGRESGCQLHRADITGELPPVRKRYRCLTPLWHDRDRDCHR